MKLTDACLKNSNTRIYCGDSLQLLDSIVENASVQLLFADPPYNRLSQSGTCAIQQYKGAW